MNTLLVAGTTSDAGKSLITAGLCRWLHREGVRVAPFKAQNMALNSMVTADGAEIGRAQAMQAAAAGVEPEAAMNPVLLKPGGDRTSQVVVLGRPDGEVTALSYRDRKPALLEIALESLRGLQQRFDVVIAEGAGSPAEINLRATDIANMGLATAADIPTLVVGDIDRGGVFAAMYGTLALLSAEDQRLVAGFVVNKFRGDDRLLAPGLDMLTNLTGRPVVGTIPWIDGLGIDVEDSLGLPPAGAVIGRPQEAVQDPLRIAVVRLPRISNVTDADALAQEPGVAVHFVDGPEQLDGADLVIVPGTRATVADLAWLHERGIAEALQRRRFPVLGICGGYQMMARTITDHVESKAGVVEGLGLLPVDITFAPDKTLGRPHGSWQGHDVVGYEIHHGLATRTGGDDFLDGARVENVFGTTWHGAFESDDFRRAFLTEVAAITGRRFVVAPDTSFEAQRQRRLDLLGDAVEQHLDTAYLRRLLDGDLPTFPFVPPGAPA